jgi:hypothetical protein
MLLRLLLLHIRQCRTVKLLLLLLAMVSQSILLRAIDPRALP